jgi:hypothetical protein
MLTYVYPLEELDFSTFVVNHNFKVSPSARCVSAANAICKETDIFNKDKITLVDISQLYLFLHLLDFVWFFC